jgi:molecular chaperone DnaK
MSKIIGIDLGTTFSEVALMEGGTAKIVENKEGGRITPSVVAITKTGERLVGILARRQQITNPQNTVYSVKRLMGRRYTDPEVQKDKKLLSYEIREAKDGSVEVKLGDKWMKPPEISAMILQKLKQDAEDKLGEKLTDVVITCPAYFDDSQRKATKVAGEIAGFNVKMILNEPTAAALAYGLTKKKGEQILVYDFGGGTFDVSVLDIRKDPDTVEVIGVGGDTHLGGDDFDQKVMGWIIDNFKKDQGIDLSKDPLALQRIKEAAEKAKIELSTSMETEINLPFVTSDASGPRHLYYKLTRAQLENLVKDYIEKSIQLVDQTLKDVKLKAKDIEEVVLVGGQTRMPAMVEAVKKYFSKEPNKSINPDEVVAVGAAVQAAIMGGEAKEVLLLDATPLSSGIETLGGVNTILIQKNTIYPVSKSQIFSTAADSQTQVEVHVLQGERPMAQDSKTLGRFILDGIPPAPRGIPQVEVTFDIDSNGIMNVSAKDKATGKSQSIRIEGSIGISKDEIEKMKKEAELHAEEDKKKKEVIEVRNLAENLIYTCEKTLKDAGEKVPADTKKEIEKKIEELRKVKDSDNIDEIKSKTQELSQAIQKVGAEMYKEKGDKGSKENKRDKDEKGKDAEEGKYKEK